jgi:predicted Rossmann fold nucleotide-binding protein DprA/Smf involved in DNA uptake
MTEARRRARPRTLETLRRDERVRAVLAVHTEPQSVQQLAGMLDWPERTVFSSLLRLRLGGTVEKIGIRYRLSSSPPRDGS